jgi:hypothetical protein
MISKQWGNSLKDTSCYHFQIKIDCNNNDFIIPTYHYNILKKNPLERKGILSRNVEPKALSRATQYKVFLEGI